MAKSWWKSHDWNAICDVCGFEFKASQLQKRWDGLMVCKDDWEMRHPQELIRPIPDQQKLPWTRPEGPDYGVDGTLVVPPTLPYNPLQPTLDLQFVDLGLGRVDITDSTGRASPTFVRGSTATTVDRNGIIVSVASGIPRSYYDPSTLEYKGFLPEGQRTNFCLQSEDFSTSWTRANILAFGGGSVVNSTTAPNNTLTADTITEDSTASVQHFLQATTIAGLSDTQSYAVSCFFKAKERTKVRLCFIDSLTVDGVGVVADLATGTVQSNPVFGAGTLGNSGVDAYPNGWYRVWVTGALNNGKTQGTVLINLVNAANQVSYNGDGVSGVYAWGAQLEDRSTSEIAGISSYIPTTTSTRTRNSDILTYAVSSSWYNPLAGTLFINFAAFHVTGPVTGTYMMASFDDGTVSNRMQYRVTATASLDFLVVAGGVTQALATIAGISRKSQHRFATAFEKNEIVGFFNGNATTGNDYAANIPTVTVFGVGNGCGGFFEPTLMPIRTVQYWPSRMPNATLIALTR